MPIQKEGKASLRGGEPKRKVDEVEGKSESSVGEMNKRLKQNQEAQEVEKRIGKNERN